jgi:predicted nucleic acid-binding protein
MSGRRAFFDTNVLLYMYGGDPGKQAAAVHLFAEHARDGGVLISTQVVQEFYAAGSRKLRIPAGVLRAATAALLELPLVVLNASHIAAAIQNEDVYKLSFWDALIIAAAESSGATVLYSEDLSHGQHYGSVVAQNPFRTVPDRP